MKVTKRLEGVDNCTASQDTFESLLAVHRDFEKWYGKLSKQKYLKYGVFVPPSMLESVFSVWDYHPILQNFAEYQTLRRDPVPFNQTEKFGLPSLIVPGNNRKYQ